MQKRVVGLLKKKPDAIAPGQHFLLKALHIMRDFLHRSSYCLTAGIFLFY